MEEAERLCDRLALIGAGRVVTVDTPAGLTDRAGIGQRVAFHLSAPFDDRLLTARPEVTAVTRDGDRVTVDGGDDVLNAVTTVLAREGVVARRLRVEQPSLEDAFVALTGRRMEGK